MVFCNRFFLALSLLDERIILLPFSASGIQLLVDSQVSDLFQFKIACSMVSG